MYVTIFVKKKKHNLGILLRVYHMYIHNTLVVEPCTQARYNLNSHEFVNH